MPSFPVSWSKPLSSTPRVARAFSHLCGFCSSSPGLPWPCVCPCLVMALHDLSLFSVFCPRMSFLGRCAHGLPSGCTFRPGIALSVRLCECPHLSCPVLAWPCPFHTFGLMFMFCALTLLGLVLASSCACVLSLSWNVFVVASVAWSSHYPNLPGPCTSSWPCARPLALSCHVFDWAVKSMSAPAPCMSLLCLFMPLCALACHFMACPCLCLLPCVL